MAAGKSQLAAAAPQSLGCGEPHALQDQIADADQSARIATASTPKRGRRSSVGGTGGFGVSPPPGVNPWTITSASIDAHGPGIPSTTVD